LRVYLGEPLVVVDLERHPIEALLGVNFVFESDIAVADKVDVYVEPGEEFHDTVKACVVARANDCAVLLGRPRLASKILPPGVATTGG
jgi:hypothetical protein